jgi:hypothetical protein
MPRGFRCLQPNYAVRMREVDDVVMKRLPSRFINGGFARKM